MTTATLVVELVTEELPPRALKALGEAFADAIERGLADRQFLEASSVSMRYATPRRLAVAITAVRAKAPDREVTEKLLPVKVARDASGGVSQALSKKLGAMGRAHLATPTLDAASGPDRVFTQSDGKADYVYLQSLAKGGSLQVGLESALEEALDRLPIPKVMAYAGQGGYFNDVRFVRPAHRLLALHGVDVVPIRALGLDAGRVTLGHRFMPHYYSDARTIEIPNADAWAPTLEAEGKVMPSFAARRAKIVAGLEAAAAGARVLAPDALLDEVTSLVEWPVVYAGSFDAAFLDVPQECLVLTMQQNQKYFALADDRGALVNRFLVVSNIATADPAAIVEGNERVLRARLADAKFFYDQDRRDPLATRVGRLAQVVYHNRLGSQHDRVERLRAIARAIAPLVGADAKQADRAALLAKADLVTDMVGEFPELQGTMGRYYARADGEAADVADAIAEHYAPRFAGDALPTGPVAQAVALADKLETLAGLFGIGQVPTGDKDPFGLRRAALGVIRILIEKRVETRIDTLVKAAFAQFPSAKDAGTDVLGFLNERLRGYLRELGYTANEVAAVVDGLPGEYWSIPDQLAAIRAFEALAEAPALAAANKRIANILRKNGVVVGSGSAVPALRINPSLLTPGAEKRLAEMFEALAALVEAKRKSGDWTGALVALAGSRATVDTFFDEVMVMADDPDVRANRLELLRFVAATMNRVADIGKLAQ
ncbi:MAG TPA: glycine--tRNA ligase subunit beta [Casimicrobiaceae bacterium]|nr:glycine--tRNA ligase subunit beta [Casimicrobiaceae bacterium]